MDQFELIRTASRVYGKSIRQLGRETGHHRVTIRKSACREGTAVSSAGEAESSGDGSGREDRRAVGGWGPPKAAQNKDTQPDACTPGCWRNMSSQGRR